MQAVNAHVAGLDALTQALQQLPDKLQRKVSRKALEKATKPVVAAVRARAPSRSKRYRRALGRKTKTYVESGTIVAIIGARKGYGGEVTVDGRTQYEDPAKIAHLVEFGTQAHVIGKAGGLHPGAKAQPHMRPGYDETRDEVQRIYGAEMGAGLERELRT